MTDLKALQKLLTDQPAANDKHYYDLTCARGQHTFDEYGLCFECDAVKPGSEIES